MESQVDRISKADRAFIVQLSSPNSNSLTDRYAIYVSKQGGDLDVVWPLVGDRYDKEGKEFKKPRLLPYQCCARTGRYPLFHFRLSGYGYSKTNEIRIMLREINPNIEVSIINGYAPSFS